jgi:hypothetical protein
MVVVLIFDRTYTGKYIIIYGDVFVIKNQFSEWYTMCLLIARYGYHDSVICQLVG